MTLFVHYVCVFFQAEDGIRDLVRSRGLGDVYKRQGKYCASTSNRNFEGRQGKGARTFLMSPIMAAAAALHGRVVDVRSMI